MTNDERQMLKMLFCYAPSDNEKWIIYRYYCLIVISENSPPKVYYKSNNGAVNVGILTNDQL